MRNDLDHRVGTVATEAVTALLAARFLGWRASPARFLIGDRGWIPRWRFQPEKNLSHAGRLLDAAAPEECSMGIAEGGCFHVRVRIGGGVGEATDRSKARAITYALARAIGVHMDSPNGDA